MDKHSDYDQYGNLNLDANTIWIANPDHDPDITTDKHGCAYIHINGHAYRYPYADTITERNDADDSERTEHAAGERDTDAEHAANNG